MFLSYLHIRLTCRLIRASAFSSLASVEDAPFNQSLPMVCNFSSLLQGISKNLVHVKTVHAQIITNSAFADHFVVSKLVKAYSDLGLINYAHQVFDHVPHPKTILCNAMISGYNKNQQYKEALQLFKMMGSFNIEIDSYTCNFALKACTSLADNEMGMEIYRIAALRGFHLDPYFGSSMINFLVKSGNLDEARKVFDQILERDVVCWNSIIGGYVQQCLFKEAIGMFFDMIGNKIRPSAVTMASILKACGESGLLKFGRCVHGCILALGMGDDVLVLTALLDMYCDVGNIESACWVFNSMCERNLVSWNAMISGYVQNGMVHESVSLFRRMVLSGASFDSGTLVSLIQGCFQTCKLESGKILHACIIRKGLESSLILSSAIVDMYAKCGAAKQATTVFRRIKERNVITWTSMLVGLSQNGFADDALKLFIQMQEENVSANSVTLVSLVHCCAHMGSLKKGMRSLKKGMSIHGHLIRHDYAFDVVSMSALIDMYVKCGKLISAEILFNYGFHLKDVICCTSMIMGYGMHGHGLHAIGVYDRMIKESLKPNHATFVALLVACSHSGLVEEGKTLFHSMERHHNIKPTEKHYACLVDLLSRVGHLEEAEALVKQMPFEPSTDVLEALLSGCQTHENIDMGVRIADRLLSLDYLNSGIYVMLSNIYAQARRWESVSYIRSLMRTRGLKKTPAFSLIEVENRVCTFFAGDDSHPKWADIYELLENLRVEVEAQGYVPDTSCVLRDVDEPMKVKLLWGHSERLAIAFGLLSTPSGSLLRITKNLRVCADCHTVTKYISKIVKREIIVRDANRFHHFVNGECSCNDFW